jgi:asparagine synthase (glutamine-hydrolysing)
MQVFETQLNSSLISDKGLWLFSFGEKICLPSKFTELVLDKSNSSKDKNYQIFLLSKNTQISVVEDASTLVLVDGVIESKFFSEDTSYIKNLLKLYKEQGEEIINKIVGTSTIIIFDKEKEKLLVFRDKLGINPIFYSQIGENYLFSPLVDVLLLSPKVSKTINRTLLAERLCDIWVSKDETYYKAIKKIPSSHFLRVSKGIAKTVPYWLASKDFSQIEWVEGDGFEMFEKLFEETLTKELSKGQSGIFLSGGLDSVSVAVMSADITRKHRLPDPIALSLFFSHPDCDEETTQKSVSKQLGLENQGLTFDESVGKDGWFFAALELSKSLPAPLSNFWWPAYMNLALKGKEKGCKVILTGGGGDEWLSVTPYLAADLLYKLDVRSLYDLWQTVIASYKISPLMNFKFLLWNCGLRLVIGSLVRKMLLSIYPNLLYQIRQTRKEKILAEWLLADPLLKKEVYERWEASESYKDIKSYYLREMQISLEHPLISLEMEENYQIEKKLNINFYQSYWNSELIELLYRLPPNILTRGKKSKGLVRDLVSKRFPNLGFEKQKKILSTNYFSVLVSDQLKKVWQKLTCPKTLIDLGIVNKNKLDFSKGLPSSGSKNPAFLAWEMANLEVWLNTHH